MDAAYVKSFSDQGERRRRERATATYTVNGGFRLKIDVPPLVSSTLIACMVWMFLKGERGG